jgi:hypothetical protein
VYGIVETAQRFGQYRWAELQMFELLGEWARSGEDAAAAKMFAAHSHHHAWHADVFAGRIPAIEGLDAPDATAVLPQLVPLVEAARAAVGTRARLTGVYDVVLPALASEYEQHLANTDPRVDGPTARALTLVLRDLAADRLDAAALKEHVQ